MNPLTPCPSCSERDPESRVWEADRWQCLACGTSWKPRGTSTLHHVDELIDLLRAPDSGLSRLARAVASGELRGYLETRQNLDLSLRREIGALLERLRSRAELALFALRYKLTNDSLELVRGVAIRSPAEIAPLVAPGAANREAVLKALRELIGDGRLGEWIRTLGLEGVVLR